jgi:hypothetical protein
MLLAGLYSNTDGESAFLLHDARSGELLGAVWLNDDWVYPVPAARTSMMDVGSDVYAVVLPRGSWYLLVRLTLDGPRTVDWFAPPPGGANYLTAVTTGQVDGRPAVLTCDGETTATAVGCGHSTAPRRSVPRSAFAAFAGARGKWPAGRAC